VGFPVPRVRSQLSVISYQMWLFSTLCDNFCLWNREMLIGQDFQHYFDGYSISIDLVSTQKLEEPRKPLIMNNFC